MANVTIWRDENTLFKSVTIPFPFTMEQFIDGLDEIGCPKELSAIEKISYHFDNINDYKHVKIIDLFVTVSDNNIPLIYINLLAVLSDSIDSYEFDKAIFYLEEVGVDSVFNFANVLCQVEESNIYSYDYSDPGENADVRLGKEVVFGIQIEDVSHWLTPYIDFEGIGEDESGEFYYNRDFYVDYNDIGIDDEYYDDWEELTGYELGEWEFAEFRELLLEQENKHEADIKFTDEILNFLEKGA